MGLRLESRTSGVLFGLGFGLVSRRGRGVEESFALLSGEADRGVEGVARPPAASKFSALLGFGISFECSKLSLGR